MKRELAFALAAELESGHHKQTHGFLCRVDSDNIAYGKCCLGVAAWMTPKVSTSIREETCVIFDGCDAWLPKATINYFGFFDDHGRRRDGKYLDFPGRSYKSLGAANDEGVPFPVIAKYIRENYEYL